MHFFNPPPQMRLVEIVAGELTRVHAPHATSVARDDGREPVRAKDSPGFIVNRCNRPYSLEALRMLGEGYATSPRSTRRCASAAAIGWARSSLWT